MKRTVCVFLACAAGAVGPLLGSDKPVPGSENVETVVSVDPATAEEDMRREQAIAEFTARMKAANYPALFEAAAKEFNVPADILKAVAFAETRWEHLTWPPGETESPKNGMPRPYGIMSLWDNKYFGHSLLEAAALIGKTPEELKNDPYQNIRGGAALLRQHYDANPKPEGTTEADIESWRYAIRKYCGIPEPDLNARHALDVYVFMSQGYHQYGIEWDGRPVNLDPIREETRRIVAEEEAKQAAAQADEAPAEAPPRPKVSPNPQPKPEAPENPEPPPPPPAQKSIKPWWIILAVVVVVAASFLLKRRLTRSDSA